ncbi:hypothetical protein NDA15_003514 [Ustilago hordei]|nr:hypothetical protein NDA15_003514 [Ustilago hordei]
MVVEAVSLRRIEDGERRSSPHSPASDDEPGLTSIPTLSGATRSSMVANNPASGRLRHPSLPLPFPPKETSYRLNSAFFLFGLLNNSLYVVILTAALELLPQGVPTGLVPKEGKGLGLVGLETNYAGDAVGWFASGTGAAGLVGAGAWWVVRGWGVQTGMAILSVLPGFMVLAYLVVCPSVEALLFAEGAGGGSGAGYAPISTSEDAAEEQADETVDAEPDTEEREDSTTPLTTAPGNIRVRLSFNEKMTLLRPMLLRYILPLVTVYFAEYTINQGVAPTLIYPLPTPSSHPLLSIIIKKLTDYYPLYQLVYQTFVFLSRSSISIFKLPAIPRTLLWLPAVLQTGLLFLLASESLYGWFRASIANPLVIVLICIEGLAGGAAYVSVFYSIGVDGRNDGNRIVLPADATQEAEGEYGEDKAYALAKKAQEQEFRIGSVGFGDSLGILAASIISMPLQVGLCNAQARDGRELCKQA